ncbi:MAG: hydrogenase maturation protease [Candidatus Bipolaricaulaceae bacterium]
MRKVLLGLGNPLGRDDGVGFYVARALQGSEWLAIPTSALENVWGTVEKAQPEKLLIVDAAEMGLPPGSVRRLPLPQGAEMVGSTHGLPLSFVLPLVQTKDIVLIGIQPKEYGVGEGLSPEVRAAADFLVRLLQEGSEGEIPELRRA